MKNPGWQRFATSYGVYKVKRRGKYWIVRTPDGSEFPYETRASALKSFGRYKRKNPNKISSVRKAKKYAKRFGATVAGFSAYGKVKGRARKTQSKQRRGNPLPTGRMVTVKLRRNRDGSVDVFK